MLKMCTHTYEYTRRRRETDKAKLANLRSWRYNRHAGFFSYQPLCAKSFTLYHSVYFQLAVTCSSLILLSAPLIQTHHTARTERTTHKLLIQAVFVFVQIWCENLYKKNDRPPVHVRLFSFHSRCYLKRLFQSSFAASFHINGCSVAFIYINTVTYTIGA